jgi:NADPH:quinone reductase-like Zn-dependent oxidoreductase
MSYITEGWVLNEDKNPSISMEEINFSKLESKEALVKPLYGCFEGNMQHAIERSPINVCKERGEKKVILGNAGVVEVLEIAPDVTNVKVGQKCLFFCNGEPDPYGFPIKIAGYDCVGSMGLLSKLSKTSEGQLIPLPDDDSISLQQWAAFSLRYITAWSNW